MRLCRGIVLVISVMCGVVLTPRESFAHGLFTSVEVRKDVVHIEVYFDEDMPAEYAKVVVTNTTGVSYGAGFANENGVFTIPLPEPGEYVVEADCEGHKVRLNFSVHGNQDSPAKFGGKPNSVLGLVAGVVVLLGISAFFWLRRQRK